MKFFPARIVLVLSLAVALAMAAGCVIHAHSSDPKAKPAETRKSKPSKAGSQQAEPAASPTGDHTFRRMTPPAGQGTAEEEAAEEDAAEEAAIEEEVGETGGGDHTFRGVTPGPTGAPQTETKYRKASPPTE